MVQLVGATGLEGGDDTPTVPDDVVGVALPLEGVEEAVGVAGALDVAAGRDDDVRAGGVLRAVLGVGLGVGLALGVGVLDVVVCPTEPEPVPPPPAVLPAVPT